MRELQTWVNLEHTTPGESQTVGSQLQEIPRIGKSRDRSQICGCQGPGTGGRESFDFKMANGALAGVALWTERRPVNQGDTNLIPSQGTCLGCGPGPQ